MSTAPIRMLVVCGSGVATSTVVAERVKALAADQGWDLQVSLCRATDVTATAGTFNPDLVVATTAISADLGVPTIKAMSLVTGIGEDQTIAEIDETLRGLAEPG